MAGISGRRNIGTVVVAESGCPAEASEEAVSAFCPCGLHDADRVVNNKKRLSLIKYIIVILFSCFADVLFAAITKNVNGRYLPKQECNRGLNHGSICNETFFRDGTRTAPCRTCFYRRFECRQT